MLECKRVRTGNVRHGAVILRGGGGVRPQGHQGHVAGAGVIGLRVGDIGSHLLGSTLKT